MPARVLVVDDEPAVLHLVAGALESRGYEVHTAGGPLAALDLVRKAKPCFDVLVSDVVMPEMCGPELARNVIRMCPRSAVVLMSGHIAGEGLPYGARFLSKPFLVSDLYRAVEMALASSGPS